MKQFDFIRKTVRKSYPFLTTTVPIILGEKNSQFLHNRIISNNWENLSPNTYEGRLACGGNCYLLSYYLKKFGIETKMMKKSIGYGKYLENHCYLLYDDSIIIDPTYRQFYTSAITKKNEYSKLLFCKNDFAFIGTLEDFKIQHEILSQKYKKTYGDTLHLKTSYFWENPNDISYLLDLEHLLENRERCIKKGDLYVQLFDCFNKNMNLI